METLLTLLLFGAITALAVRAHLRRGRAGRESGPSPAPAARCPRCDAEVVEGALTCSGCRAPLQAFEVVAAEAAAGGDGEGGQLHAVLRADLCVGCGACVDACEGPRAIRMQGKVAVVDLAACIGLGDCAEACPVGALVLSTGESVQRVEVPRLDTNFQSNIPGLYIVGELGGRGLIKNAVNEGKLAVEHVAGELERGGLSFEAIDPSIHDVAIVGTGPAGLSAALEAKRRGLSYLLLERGTIADTIRKYPRRKLLLAEPVKVPLYGDLWVADASKESLLSVWERVIRDTGLDVRTNHDVTGIRPEEDRFALEAAGQVFLARRVILALGRRGKPRRLGVPGEELSKTLYDVVEMEIFAGRKVLVVGGGDSAVESAVGLSRQPGTRVALSYRGERFKRVKDRNQEKLDEAVASGRLSLLMQSRLKEIREESVLLEMNGKTSSLPNDDVIVRIGGEPPYEFLKQVGVQLVRKNIPLAGNGDPGA